MDDRLADWYLDEMQRLEIARDAQHRVTFLLGQFRSEGINARVIAAEAHRGAGVHIGIALNETHRVDGWVRDDGSIDEWRIAAMRINKLHLDDPDQATAVYVTRQFCGLVGDK
jgi:hypothetical protein